MLRRFQGSARIWRTDRLATVVVPGRREVQPSFAPVARHYGVVVEPCPPRRGNRKGAVEASVRYVSGRWWRTMTATTPEDAQRSLDRFLADQADARLRPLARLAEQERGDRRPPTVAELAEAEPLLPLPLAPYPATITAAAVVAADATVAFRGNRYSVPPGLGGSTLALRHRLGTSTLSVHAGSGTLLVTHRLQRPGTGAIVRSGEHRAALESAVLAAFSTRRPCDRKANRPPGEAARAAAAKLLTELGPAVLVDLEHYAAMAASSTGGAR